MDIYGVHSKNTILSDYGVLQRQKQISSASDAPQGLFSATFTQEMQETIASNKDLTTQRYTFDEFNFPLASREMLDNSSIKPILQEAPPSYSEDDLQSQELPEFNVSFLEKLKSGMSFQDALLATKYERFGYYFLEALKSNDGDVEEALKQAEAQLKGETSLSDEELYAIVKDLASGYNQAAAQTGSDEMQRIAEELNRYLEELEKRIDLDNVPTLNGTASTTTVDGEEEKDLKASFVQDLMKTSSLSDEDISLNEDKNVRSQLTEKEKKEREVAIKQYQKMASFGLQ